MNGHAMATSPFGPTAMRATFRVKRVRAAGPIPVQRRLQASFPVVSYFSTTSAKTPVPSSLGCATVNTSPAASTARASIGASEIATDQSGRGGPVSAETTVADVSGADDDAGRAGAECVVDGPCAVGPPHENVRAIEA